MRRLAIVTGPRRGGPLGWSRALAAQVNRNGAFAARVIHRLPAVLLAELVPPADLVHTTLPSAFHLWRRPFVLTVHGEYPVESALSAKLYPRAIGRAAVVTVPSEYLRERIPALQGAVVIPNAVDLDRFRTVGPRDASGERSIVTVTNFWFPDKARGVEYLLTLLAKVAADRSAPRFRLTVVGDGPHLGPVRTSARRAAFPVAFTGWTDPRPLLERADLFLYRSEHDNLPNTVLEAMASGLPVVANPVGALPEVITHGQDGFLSDEDDVLIELLRSLLTDSARRRAIGRRARATIERRFSWTVVLPRFLEVYRRIER